MIDPSSPDLAGRVLEAFGKIGLRPGHPAVDRALAYVRRSQEADGSWYGRWGVNYVYGTWQVLEGLRAIGIPADDQAVRCGAEWLETCQQADGGWGETPESYADRSLAGTGTPTASQTAWAVAALSPCTPPMTAFVPACVPVSMPAGPTVPGMTDARLLPPAPAPRATDSDPYPM
jgi:squalene-hopene/tetraprenyl-beta-curcumene cyclase